jgi:hypothetical protein
MGNNSGLNLKNQMFREIFSAAWFKSIAVGIGTSGWGSCGIEPLIPDVFVICVAFGAKRDDAPMSLAVTKRSEEYTS